MKKIIKTFIVSCLMMFGLMSCTNEFDTSDINVVNIVNAPKVVAYSGDKTWETLSVSSRSAQPNENEWGEEVNNGKYKDYPKPADITAEELEKVLEVFNQKGKESYEPLVDWSNFFVQQVYCGPEGDKMTELACWDPNGHEYTTYPDWNNWQAWTETVYDDIVNNFNNGAYSGNKEQGCMLMFYSSTTNWSFKSTQGGGERFYNWRMEYIDGAYYVGFDFQSNKQGSDANENELFERDYIYNDWIIKIVPGVGTDVVPPTTDEDITNKPETPENPEPETPNTPGDVEKTHNSEVEINLHGVEKGENSDYLESHLSIHVRHAGDVEVFIPVPAEYYCDADDMAIVQKHEGNLLIHGGPTKTEFNIDGNIVTLNVEFLDGGIRIWTEGINEDVINYLEENYQDGITFEVWNYFNESITLDILKPYLDDSTVKFLNEKYPDMYVNSFADDEHDCFVNIIPEQSNKYDKGVRNSHGCHSNGSNDNLIYTKE